MNESKVAKNTFWVVTTILATSGIFAFTANIFFRLFFNSLLFSSPFLNYLISLLIIFCGLLLGLSFVISKVQLTEKQSRNLPAWLLLLIFIPVINVIKNNSWTAGSFNALEVSQFVVQLLAKLIVTYFGAKLILSNSITISKHLTASRVRVAELIFLILIPIMLVYSLYNPLTQINALPEPYRQEMLKKYQINKKNELERNDKILVQYVESYNGLIKDYYFTQHKYPDELTGPWFSFFNSSLFTQADKKDFNISREAMTYSASDSGQSYKLCAQLSSGEKCWEGSAN